MSRIYRHSIPSFRHILLSLSSTTTLFFALSSVKAEDWSQWRGPQRNGISKEKGLLKSWATEGPKLLWKIENAGGGYCTPSVAQGKIFGMGYRDDREILWAMDATTGHEIWATPIAQANRRGKGYEQGSRSTPTVDGTRVYVIGDSGDFVCADVKTGKVLWSKDLVDNFKGHVPDWGYSESPLIDGDKVIVTPGGSQATLIALNKQTGDLLWKCAIPNNNTAGYASCIVATVDGVRQYIQFTAGGGIGVAAEDGKLLWRYMRHNGVTANIATPLYADNHVFISAAYGTGGGLIRLTRGSDSFKAEEVYFTQQLKSKHGGMILLGDYIYAMDDPRTLVCLEYKTGKVMWSNGSVGGNASVCYADGQLYVRSQGGATALVEATPSGYIEKGRFNQPQRTGRETWAHPVVANGRLYLRDQNVVYCYDVKQH